MVVEVCDGDGKAEISILEHSILMKDVCWLNISMHEASSIDICISFNQLPYDVYCLRKGVYFLGFNKCIEISLTQFSDDVGVVPRGVDVVEMKDVRGVGECLEGGHLELKEHLIYGVLEFGHLNDFDTDFLSVSIVDAFMDCTGIPFSYVLCHFVGVAFDCLHQPLNIIINNKFNIASNSTNILKLPLIFCQYTVY